MDKPAKYTYQPDYAVAPGEVLADELEARGMTQKDLAERSGLSPDQLDSLAQANAAITPDTAVRLESALGMPVEYWLNLEARYQEALARIARTDKPDKGL
jgi:addiction module HigA family antidote